MKGHIRRSSANSSFSSNRRSSINGKDLEKIRELLNSKPTRSREEAIASLIIFPLIVFLVLAASRQHKSSPFTDQLTTDCLDVVTDSTGWAIVSGVVFVQLLFVLVLPADEYVVRLARGEKKVINANSFTSGVLVVLLYILGSALGLYPGTIAYDHIGGLVGGMSFLAAALSVTHYYFAEYRSDDLLTDLFYGIEGNLTIGTSFDSRHFATHRIGLTCWAIYTVSCFYHAVSIGLNPNRTLLTLIALQLLYISRRLWTEYLSYANLDAQLEGVGWQRLWTGSVFLMVVYSSTVPIFVHSPRRDNIYTCAVMAVVNLIAQFVNTDIDLQRYNFRAADGNVKIRDKDPFFMSAKYRSEGGETKVSLLLGSGYFASARHLNYTAEVITFLTWCLLRRPTSFIVFISPLTVALLLARRMKSDELRCLAKYNQYWLQFTSKVRYLAIPGVY